MLGRNPYNGQLKACASLFMHRTKHPSFNITTASFHNLLNPLFKCAEGGGGGITSKISNFFSRTTKERGRCPGDKKPVPEKPVVMECKEIKPTRICDPQSIRIIKSCDQDRAGEKPGKPVEKQKRLFYDACSENDTFLLEAPKPCKPAPVVVPVQKPAPEKKVTPIVVPVVKKEKPVAACLPPCRPPLGITERIVRLFWPVAGFMLGYYLHGPQPPPAPPKPSKIVVVPPPPKPVIVPPPPPEKSPLKIFELIKPKEEPKPRDSCTEGRIEIYTRFCKDCPVVDAVKIYRD